MKSERRMGRMKTCVSIILTLVLGMCGMSLAPAQVKQPGDGRLAFFASGTNEFAFDTGVLKGKLRAGGKSTGLSSVVHVPTGMRLDSSMGLFGHYRVFSANKRYGTAAWDWPSEAKLRPDGSVEVRWPSADDRPFELRAVYRWAAPDTLDLETSVQAKRNMAKFESFLASYLCGRLHECERVCALQRPGMASGGRPRVMASGRHSRATNRQCQSFKMGAGRFQPNPVDWVIRPYLAKPLGVRGCPANDLRAVVMSPPSGLLRCANAVRGRTASLDVFLPLRQGPESGRNRAGQGAAGDRDRACGRDHDRLYTDYLRPSR